MRASRLLRLLLQLQNGGKVTTRRLAAELEVTRRTIFRDIEALCEAGLPVVVHRGPRGGVELGFNYRSRLTGLSSSESEALGVWLGAPSPALDALGLGDAGRLASAKLLESLPDGVRHIALKAQRQFRIAVPRRRSAEDPRLKPLALAVRQSRRVRIRARRPSPRTIHPIALVLRARGWAVIDALDPTAPIPLDACEDINISGLKFDAADHE